MLYSKMECPEIVPDLNFDPIDTPRPSLLPIVCLFLIGIAIGYFLARYSFQKVIKKVIDDKTELYKKVRFESPVERTYMTGTPFEKPEPKPSTHNESMSISDPVTIRMSDLVYRPSRIVEEIQPAPEPVDVSEDPKGAEETKITEDPKGAEETKVTEDPKGVEETKVTEDPKGVEETKVTEDPKEEATVKLDGPVVKPATKPKRVTRRKKETNKSFGEESKAPAVESKAMLPEPLEVVPERAPEVPERAPEVPERAPEVPERAPEVPEFTDASTEVLL